MKLISRKDLKKKLDDNHDFKLVMVLGEWHFNAKRIPGSIHVDSPKKAIEHLHKEDEIVVYCSNINCIASIVAFEKLSQAGFNKVHRYAGGIADWEKAGHPLEGEMAN